MLKIAQESALRHNVLEWVHRQAKSCVVGIFLVCVLQKICMRERCETMSKQHLTAIS